MSERHQPPGPDEAPLPPITSAAERRTDERRASYLVRRRAPDTTPWAVIGIGAVICLLGVLLLRFTAGLVAWGGIALGALGSVVITIGAVAEGIRLGARWVAFDRGD